MNLLEKGSEQFNLGRLPAPFNSLEGYEKAQIFLTANNKNYTPWQSFSQTRKRFSVQCREGIDGDPSERLAD